MSKNRWIPIKEDIPENDELMLVTVKDNKLIHDNLVMIGCYTYEQGWILNGYIDLVDLNVIAWMPLPKPYKEGEQE